MRQMTLVEGNDEVVLSLEVDMRPLEGRILCQSLWWLVEVSWWRAVDDSSLVRAARLGAFLLD